MSTAAVDPTLSIGDGVQTVGVPARSVVVLRRTPHADAEAGAPAADVSARLGA
jgi:hypothetical protein